ncbi:telomere length regulation protein TEL2 homolog isoform X2 [Dreissena polymorpha]|uniref:telomere length regulation protein TEL2 homolog isoform X2 n=1 Tax=Dreissena polymorpha TaxID=45954 RepID=UPI002263F348|nr:telomere length regulation protein TEL2 homolog isoform X2 [Dreissena polymorpha]
MSLQSNVRASVREIQNNLRRASSKDAFVKGLKCACEFLPCQQNQKADEICHQLDESSEVFLKNHHSQFIQFLLDIMNMDNVGQLNKDEFTKYFLIFFLNGSCENALLAVLSFIGRSGPSYQLNKSIAILEEFLRQHKIATILQEQSGLLRPSTCYLYEWKSEGRTLLWESLVSEIASIPDKMANKLKTEISDIFHPKRYIPLLISDILSTLGMVCKYIRLSKDCSLEFISHLVGKLCISGYADQFWDIMLQQTMLLVRQDFIWSRVMETIVTRVPDRCMESVLVPLVKALGWYGLMDRFLGNCVTQNQKIQLLLCTKLIFHRYFSTPQVLQNVIGYLATGASRKYLYAKMLKELVQVWGDRSSVQHTSYEQHYYLTQALVISMAFLNDPQKHELKDELLRHLLTSVDNHISFADARIRKLGMLVGEIITRKLEPDGPDLNFEVGDDDEVKELRSLLVVPEDHFNIEIPDELSMLLSENGTEVALLGIDEFLESSEPSSVMSSAGAQKPVTSSVTSSQDIQTCDPPSDLDSDDDLEPYDLTNDTDKSKVKQPKYIRDCMEDLINNEGPNKVGEALKAAESLIRGNPFGLTEISAEFSKVLLHLTDEYSLPDFRKNRFNSLVALAVMAPKQVACYLSEQFYERNYSIRQRLDVIEVLGTAAQELSKPTDLNTGKGDKPNISKIEELPPPSSEPEKWQEVVQRRIDSKTRRFGQGKTRPELKAVENKFSPVAGHFFYPLLKHFDRTENTFDLMGEDCFVLGRLMYTLGIVMYAAANSPPAKQMGKTLLEFIWVLRFHSDSKVRQGLLFAVSMVYLSVPAHMLLNDLQQEVFESKNWLEDVIDKDVNVTCKTLAVQALVLLENIIKQELLCDTDFT